MKGLRLPHGDIDIPQLVDGLGDLSMKAPLLKSLPDRDPAGDRKKHLASRPKV